MLFISPRYTATGFARAFEVLDCKAMLVTSPRPPFAAPILEAYPLRTIEAPSIEVMLSTTYPYFPYNKTFEEAKDEPLFALFTSGTTGLPKPVIYTHDWAASLMRMAILDPPTGFVSHIRM